jgi:Contractile injection system tube protein
MTDIQITRARLVPLDGNERAAENQWIPVQFNPNSLRITYSNTIKVEQGTQNNPPPAPQFIDKSESSLSVQLIYDTSVPGPLNSEFLWDLNSTNSEQTTNASEFSGDQSASTHQANTDVRLLTQRIADTFMKPVAQEGSTNNLIPKKCQFEWGAFIFRGLISSYNETLDFFSPEGIPLRATVALTLKEDSYQFDRSNQAANQRATPNFASADSASGVAQAAAANKKNPKNWRDMALLNGIEDVRAIGRNAIEVPQAGLEDLASRSGSQATGFVVGASASLGSNIPGAFKWK